MNSDQKEDHLEGVQDEGTAYMQRKGWTLTCLYCDYEAVGKTKTEALVWMNKHWEPMGITCTP